MHLREFFPLEDDTEKIGQMNKKCTAIAVWYWTKGDLIEHVPVEIGVTMFMIGKLAYSKMWNTNFIFFVWEDSYNKQVLDLIWI